jgi:protein tyrosine phosphatase
MNLFQGYRKPKKYIAAQGPMEHTSSDFWRMIWSEEIPTIVMLTAVVERAKIKCHQYWPREDGGVATYGRIFSIKLEDTDVYADFTVRTLTIIHKEELRSVRQYHFTAWPDHDVPKFATGLLSFIRRVNRDHGQKKGPIAVHCRQE